MTSDQELEIKISEVNKAFYDRIYRDPWLKLIFGNIAQWYIESQQTDFMLGALGGPKHYRGLTPSQAHSHIFIDEEMWQLREKYLREAFEEVKFPQDLADKWLKIDHSFKRVVLKKSPSECKRPSLFGKVINIPNPHRKRS